MNKSSHVPIYGNPRFPAEKRVKDQLSQVTLEEETAQMMCVWQEKPTKPVDAQGNFEQSSL